MWTCRVCGKEAEYILDSGTSQMDKKGWYNNGWDIADLIQQ
jgi:hypothetical protein